MARRALKDVAKEMLVQRDKAKAAFQRADELLDELLAQKDVGESVRLEDGRRVVVVDHFLDREGNLKNTVWKSSGVKRFDVEVINE